MLIIRVRCFFGIVQTAHSYKHIKVLYLVNIALFYQFDALIAFFWYQKVK